MSWAMNKGNRYYPSLLLGVGTVFIVSGLDSAASTLGVNVCQTLTNIGANRVLEGLNSCQDPVGIGYMAGLILIALVSGGGFFFVSW